MGIKRRVQEYMTQQYKTIQDKTTRQGDMRYEYCTPQYHTPCHPVAYTTQSFMSTVGIRIDRVDLGRYEAWPNRFGDMVRNLMLR